LEGSSPSAAQLSFARKIASDANIDLSEAILGHRAALSAFIKKNKSKPSKGGEWWSGQLNIHGTQRCAAAPLERTFVCCAA
jgi:hypothetical protein